MLNFKPLILIPLHNHSKTIPEVAKGALRYCKDILIIDDGSSDGGYGASLEGGINLLVFKKNRGKGAAILEGARFASDRGFTHILTIDADGQHLTNDICALLDAAKQNPRSIIIGKRDFSAPHIPKASIFGRAFAGFWAKIQTGKTIKDGQSGFRVYPLNIFGKYRIFSRHFDFEVEVIVKALWTGFEVKELNVGVFYPPKGKRISHFNFLWDNARLALLNTYLTFRSMMPVPHKQYFIDESGEGRALNPFKALIWQMRKKENPFWLAKSAAWGSFCGALALPGIRNFILLIGVGWFNLNRLVSFSVDKLAAPPFVPFICIEAGYYIRHKRFLTEISWQIVGHQFLQRVWEWFIGSLIIAPIFGFVVGAIVFAIGHILRKSALYGSNDGFAKAPRQFASEAQTDRPSTEGRWTGKSRGNSFFQNLGLALIKAGGRKTAYFLLYFIAAFYTLLPSIIKGASHYLKRRFPCDGKIKRFFRVYRLNLAFGRVLIDRAVFGLTGKIEVDFTQSARVKLRELFLKNNSLIVLTAHCGCWQTAMPAIEIFDMGERERYVLYHKSQDDIDKHSYEIAGKEAPVHFIDPLSFAGGAVDLMAALQKGSLACIMGDRTFGSKNNFVNVDFLGGQIEVPFSVYRIAGALNIPIAVMFFPYKGRGKLACITYEILYPQDKGSKAQNYIEDAAKFVAALERFTKEHPYEFFNYFNMWRKDD